MLAGHAVRAALGRRRPAPRVDSSRLARLTAGTEVEVLSTQLREARAYYAATSQRGRTVVSNHGQSPSPLAKTAVTGNAADLAAYAVASTLILNLDEAITHE